MNETTPTPERRNSRRRKPRASVRAYLRLGGLDIGPDLALSLLDLSEGGAGLLVKQAIEVGKEVSVGLEGQGTRDRLLRRAEGDRVIDVMRTQRHISLVHVDATDQFLDGAPWPSILDVVSLSAIAVIAHIGRLQGR